MKLSIRIFLMMSILVGFSSGCAGDDFRCDTDFKPSCIDSKTAKICTHGEIAHWECSANQSCSNGRCTATADSSNK